MEGRAPGEIRGQSRILQPLFPGKQRDIGAGERSETIEIVITLDQQKERVDGRCNLDVGEESPRQLVPAQALKPEHCQKKNSRSHEIEAGSETSQQVQP